MAVVPFTKMSGTGNDFIVIDNRNHVLAEDQLSSFARKHCPRRTGVGADGMLCLENDSEYAFQMRYINADGGEVDMCGNGARCMVMFAKSCGAMLENPVTFRTMAGPITAWMNEDTVKLHMTKPTLIESISKLPLPGGKRDVYFVNTGVPHVVVPVEDTDHIDIAELGAAIRYHKHFKPDGTNANFVQSVKPGHILVRTYERGVEDETLSCGTGSVASALVTAMISNVQSPITVHTMGGDELLVHFDGDAPGFTAAYLEGPTDVTFKGELEL